jgi:putative ABC transport system permease protein
VKAIEVWTIAQGTAHLRNLPESNSDRDIKLRGLPMPSLIYAPDLRQGRWLTSADQQGMVLNQALATDLGVGVGDWLTVKITGKRDSDWQIIGLVFEPLEQVTAFVLQPELQHVIHQSGQGKAIYVQTYHTDADTEAEVATNLRNIYENKGYEVVVTLSDTAHKTVFYRLLQLAMALTILSFMTAITALVGTIALSGTLSINVLDRTREIGMMRAIGASSRAISGQFIGEGLMLGWLSWLIAIPLSIPMCKGMLFNIGHILNVTVVYKFSMTGMVSWFFIITILAILASWFPARKAANTSVRDSLSYA